MKVVVIVLALAFGLQSFAQDSKSEGAHEGKHGIEHKAEILKNIDERIAKLNEHKSCVSAAADNEALKKCHESMKEFRHEQKEERKERREERKEKRKERREKRKENQESKE